MVWVALGVALVALAIAVVAYRRAVGAEDTARFVARRPRSWRRHSALLLKRDGPPPPERATADSTERPDRRRPHRAGRTRRR
jgi:hypothetical protein